jgi:hypothetical protein
MLQSWINDFKRSMSATITGYLLQALAVVPLIVAVGFATAAIVIWLEAALGSTAAAYLVVAAGFALLGIVFLLFAKSVEQGAPEPSAEQKEAEASAKQSSMFDGSLGAIAGLVAANPMMALGGLRVVLRNLPALLAGAVLGGLLFSDSRARANAVQRDRAEPAE